MAWGQILLVVRATHIGRKTEHSLLFLLFPPMFVNSHSQAHLTQVLSMLDSDPDSVVAHMNNLRDALWAPATMHVGVIGDKEKLGMGAASYLCGRARVGWGGGGGGGGGLEGKGGPRQAQGPKKNPQGGVEK